MKTLALSDGDLSLSGNGYTMVEGVDRVQQQLGLCLRETYGTDRFHRRWGSVLPTWIGQAIVNASLPIEIKSEMSRVVKNFVAAQNTAIENRALSAQRAVITPNEVITAVTSITTQQRQDVIIAKMTLQTAGGREFSITTAPGGSNGNAQ